MSDVTIVGAGPVGLFLALRLHALGLTPRVLERRRAGHGESRSIGVHPPSLERLDALGVGAALVARGVRVRRGRAFVGGDPAGTLALDRGPGPHRYVLAVPQHETERVLREALEARAPRALVEGVEVRSLEVGADALRLRVVDARGARDEDAAFVVACDGRRSACRESGALGFEGGAYAGRYLMGDAPDETRLGEDAGIFLHPRGLVESFPLPGGWRRWVVRRDQGGAGEAASPGELAETVRARTGHRVDGGRFVRTSGFVAERYVATRLARGRLALAGDAAHVVSPIGGQGMNLGWLGAWSLAGALHAAVVGGDPGALARDARRRRRQAQAAARRAELDMWLGRPGAGAGRRRLLAALLRGPWAGLLARLFTMRGLGGSG